MFDEFKGLPVKEREGNILKLYQNAAERGDAAAQNDLGASVEMGYAGLEVSLYWRSFITVTEYSHVLNAAGL